MPHLFYCLDLQPYTWTHLHRDPGPISSVLLACLGRNIHLALQNGVDVKTVSSILGHFSAGFTLDTYAHVTTTAQREAAKKMDGVLGQRVP